MAGDAWRIAAMEAEAEEAWPAEPDPEDEPIVGADPAVCVEIYAHQGKLKGSQPAKRMSDMGRLMLVERLLYERAGRRCRKVLGCSNPEVIRLLSNGSWRHRFVEEFGIELITVDISDETRAKLEEAQIRQFR